MGLIGILVGLAGLIFFAYRGSSILILAPIAGLIAAAFAGYPLLASWTQTFMSNAAVFIAQFFPLFLLGALFGKLMEDSGSVTSIANYMVTKLGAQRAILAVVLAGAIVTYGGVSLFVAFFVIAPMGMALFSQAGVPRRLMPAAIALGTSTFTMSAMPGTPAIQNAIPMPFFGTTPFAAPGFGILASLIMLGFGLWWLQRAEAKARATGEGFGPIASDAADKAADDPLVRERASTAREFDPAEVHRSAEAPSGPPIALAALPLVVVIVVNLAMSFFILPRMDVAFLAEPQWGATTMSAVGGLWSVMVALLAAIVTVIAINFRSVPASASDDDRWRQRLGAADRLGREPGRLRCGGRVAARLCIGARLGAVHRRRPAGVAGGRDQHPCRADRLGLGRSHDCARCARPDLYEARRRNRHQPRVDASRRGDRRRHARLAAA